MKPVSVGIIGCGVVGQYHLKAARELASVNLLALADVRADAARAAAEKFSVGKVYSSAEELIADPQIEAVVLAMPAFVRTLLALRAFAAGKHVLTEKPVAMNSAEVERMIAARGKLTAGCCSMRYRVTESGKVAANFLASGALGELRLLRCRGIRAAGAPPKTPPPPWRLKKAMNGGGILTNWGCYDLDFLLGLTRWSLKPKLVLAQTWTVAPQFSAHVAPESDAETHLAALIRCDNGAQASPPVTITFERGEFVAAQSDEAVQIIGSKGSLRLTMTPSKDKQIIHDNSSAEQGVVSKVIWQGSEDWDGTHVSPLRDFCAAIREGRPTETSLENALVVQKITDAIYASADKGEAVAL